MSAELEEGAGPVATGEGTIEEALELLCIIGGMNEAHFNRLLDEMVELRALADENAGIYLTAEQKAALQAERNSHVSAMLTKLADVPAPSRFADDRSREQIAAYFAHRLKAADERNVINLERWHAGLRDAWELANVGNATTRTGDPA